MLSNPGIICYNIHGLFEVPGYGLAGGYSGTFFSLDKDSILINLWTIKLIRKWTIGEIINNLELLAPWNETVKAEIERRANESNQSYVTCQGAPATEK